MTRVSLRKLPTNYLIRGMLHMFKCHAAILTLCVADLIDKLALRVKSDDSLETLHSCGKCDKQYPSGDMYLCTAVDCTRVGDESLRN